MAAKQPLRVGDKVRWTSQAAGLTATKLGVVIEVVPTGKRLDLHGAGFQRDHESYLIKASVVRKDGVARYTKKYWPRVSALELVTP